MLGMGMGGKRDLGMGMSGKRDLGMGMGGKRDAEKEILCAFPTCTWQPRPHTVLGGLICNHKVCQCSRKCFKRKLII